MKSLTKSFALLPRASLLAACFISALSGLPVASAHADDGSKIAFVSSERILREANPAKAAQVKIEAEFSKRDKDLQDQAASLKAKADKIDKDSAVISDFERTKRQRELSDLDKDFQRKQREFREDLNQRRNEELAIVLERSTKAIKQIAEAEKYDMVFQEGGVYVSPRIDITDKVLKILNK